MRPFIRIILFWTCWLSSFGVMAHEAHGMVEKTDLSLVVAEKLEAAPTVANFFDLAAWPESVHAAVQGDHADSDAHLRSRHQQWRSIRLEVCDSLVAARKCCLSPTYSTYFSFKPWIDYTDPHLLYSYRLFLF